MSEFFKWLEKGRGGGRLRGILIAVIVEMPPVAKRKEMHSQHNINRKSPFSSDSLPCHYRVLRWPQHSMDYYYPFWRLNWLLHWPMYSSLSLVTQQHTQLIFFDCCGCCFWLAGGPPANNQTPFQCSLHHHHQHLQRARVSSGEWPSIYSYNTGSGKKL